MMATQIKRLDEKDVAHLLVLLDLKQSDIARGINVTPPVVSQALSRERDYPQTLERIADFICRVLKAALPRLDEKDVAHLLVLLDLKQSDIARGIDFICEVLKRKLCGKRH